MVLYQVKKPQKSGNRREVHIYIFFQQVTNYKYFNRLHYDNIRSED